MPTTNEIFEKEVLLHDKHAFDPVFNFWKGSIQAAETAYTYAAPDEKPFRYIDLAMIVSMCDRSSKAFIDAAFQKEAILKLPVYVHYFDQETEKSLYKQVKGVRSWIYSKEAKFGFTPDKVTKEAGGIPKKFIADHMASGSLAEGLKLYAESAKKVIHNVCAYDSVLEDISLETSERLKKAKLGFSVQPYCDGKIEKWYAYSWLVDKLAFPYMVAMNNSGLSLPSSAIQMKDLGVLPFYYRPTISDSTNPPHLSGCWTPAAMYLLAETVDESQEKFVDKVFSMLKFAKGYYANRQTYSSFTEPRKAGLVKVLSAYPSQWAFLDDYVGLVANITSIPVPDGNPLKAFESPYMDCLCDETPKKRIPVSPARKNPPGSVLTKQSTSIVNRNRIPVLVTYHGSQYDNYDGDDFLY